MKTIEENLKEHEEILKALKGMPFEFTIRNGDYKAGYKYTCTNICLQFNKNGVVQNAYAGRYKDHISCVEIELYKYLTDLEKQLFKSHGFYVINECTGIKREASITMLRKRCVIYDV